MVEIGGPGDILRVHADTKALDVTPAVASGAVPHGVLVHAVNVGLVAAYRADPAHDLLPARIVMMIVSSAFIPSRAHKEWDHAYLGRQPVGMDERRPNRTRDLEVLARVVVVGPGGAFGCADAR